MADRSWEDCEKWPHRSVDAARKARRYSYEAFGRALGGMSASTARLLCVSDYKRWPHESTNNVVKAFVAEVAEGHRKTLAQWLEKHETEGAARPCPK